MKRENACDGRLHSACAGTVSSTWPSSSEMSDRTRSSSEMVSSEGGMDEREDEEKESGNMKIDCGRKNHKGGKNTKGKKSGDGRGHDMRAQPQSEGANHEKPRQSMHLCVSNNSTPFQSNNVRDMQKKQNKNNNVRDVHKVGSCEGKKRKEKRHNISQ